MRASLVEWSARANPQTVPNDACPSCGTLMRTTKGTLRLTVNGEEVRVARVPHLVCPKCHEEVLSYTQARRAEEDAVGIYRKRYGLLSSDEIRDLRKRNGLTQAELARLLRLGANTISRWEAGRNVQTAALDQLLRLIRDLPGGVEYLREHAA